jgi:hypothetical protein
VTQTSSTDANLVKQTGIEAAKIQFPHDTSYEVVRYEETGKCVLEEPFIMTTLGRARYMEQVKS